MIKITDISANNPALKFVENRIADNKYRGLHLSQHNRYTMDDIRVILQKLQKVTSQKNPLLRIRDTDTSKRKHNTPEEKAYAQFCDEVVAEIGKGTQDAMRKNFFLDMHRMGLIKRYRENSRGEIIEVPPHKLSRNIKYVSLTDFGRQIANEPNVKKRQYLYANALNGLIGGTISTVLNITRNYRLGEYLLLSEFMFFVSAIAPGFSFSRTESEIAELIRAYRDLLSRTQKQGATDVAKKLLDPQNFTGKVKTKKRDFHNWRNEAQQIFTLLGQTPFFEFVDEKIVARTTGAKDDPKVKLKRSIAEKSAYFKNHSIKPERISRQGFELHHVVPLALAEDAEHFYILDKWENMVCIDGHSHAKITQNGSRNVIMSARGKDLILSEYAGRDISLEYDKNVKYDPALQQNMLDYNAELRATV